MTVEYKKLLRTCVRTYARTFRKPLSYCHLSSACLCLPTGSGMFPLCMFFLHSKCKDTKFFLYFQIIPQLFYAKNFRCGVICTLYGAKNPYAKSVCYGVQTPKRRLFLSTDIIRITRKKQKNKILFGLLLFYSYLCTRFPRNRWQEITRDLLCCAWNDNNNN